MLNIINVRYILREYSMKEEEIGMRGEEPKGGSVRGEVWERTKRVKKQTNNEEQK